MAHYQNQYGAVPASKDPIQKEMDLSGDITGAGVVGSGGGSGSGSTQVITDDTTATADTTGVGVGIGSANAISDHAAVEGEHHHKKKGIIEKIKDKLPGTHHKK